jgi:hypothetical protein
VRSSETSYEKARKVKREGIEIKVEGREIRRKASESEDYIKRSSGVNL